MCNTHASTNRDVETSQFTVIANNRDEAQIVGENVDVVGRRYGDSNFELDNTVSMDKKTRAGRGTFRGQIKFAV